MRHLFYILVMLNIIVFAAIIGNKVFRQYLPAQPQGNAQAPQQQPVVVSPPQIIINTGDLQNASAVRAAVNGSNVQVQQPNRRAVQAQQGKPAPSREKTADKAHKAPAVRNISVQGNNSEPVERLGTPRVQYKACSARVSIPEDDYHRIKGLLRKYPHAASRQVVQGGGEDGGQSSARMNVLFMSVNDQEAGAIQGVVGRYGQLSRTPCNH
ncbi:cell division protein [Conchiformibius steedae DSM 2580]|uniref:Cell division protein n=2 Tax=Conchiformibius steedae TaxID=153493 RepID=A0A3P2ADJ5_9NEIS|nr:hypothetical protein [Conchiformibius steedae]QMT32802.1 cell division protein [Conchiformibius steedae]RRD91703.1 cell division protein [Conchiformibius steedae]URD67413.1 cell division protein [Conchiformibius steedae DSM 2580]